MTTSGTYPWRRTADINREHALFELLDGEAPVLDIGFTDDGIFEVAFNPSIGGKVMEWKMLLKLLGEGSRALAENESSTQPACSYHRSRAGLEVRRILAEIGSISVDWQAHTLEFAAQHVADRLRQRLPQLSSEALSALAWKFSFDWR